MKYLFFALLLLILMCSKLNLGLFAQTHLIANYPRISALENEIFNATYDNDDVDIRLERLEKKLFGKANTSMDLSERTDRLEAVIDPDYNSNSIKPNDRISLTLQALEQQVMGHSYKNESTEKRVKRLEEKILGASQSGDIEDRLITIEKAVNSSRYSSNSFPTSTGFDLGSFGYSSSNYPECDSSTGTRNPGMMNVIQNLLLEILKGYIGQTGGYYPYNNYNSGLYPNQYYDYNYPRYNTSQYGQYGQGGSVRILK